MIIYGSVNRPVVSRAWVCEPTQPRCWRAGGWGGGGVNSILRDICLETRFLLATAEWAQAGRCFLTLMSLPNETSDSSGRWFTALLESNIPGAAARVNPS